MKKGVVLINTARGKIVKLDALVRAIREKKVSCAGMDVFEHEELLTKKKKEDNLIHYLLGNKNVLITPHMAFYSKESRQREIETTLENINCFLHDKPCGE